MRHFLWLPPRLCQSRLKPGIKETLYNVGVLTWRSSVAFVMTEWNKTEQATDFTWNLQTHSSWRRTLPPVVIGAWAFCLSPLLVPSAICAAFSSMVIILHWQWFYIIEFCFWHLNVKTSRPTHGEVLVSSEVRAIVISFCLFFILVNMTTWSDFSQYC